MVSLLIVSALVVAAAAAAQAIAGFGFALLAVPVLAVVADATSAVVGTSVVSIIPAGVTVLRERGYVRWRAAAALLLAAAVGMPFGLLVLRELPERGRTALIAVVVLASAALVWRPPRAVHPGAAMVTLTGVLTGVLTTATGTNGPPLVASLQAMGFGQRALRATVAAVFVGTSVLGALGFVLAAAVTERALLLAAVGVPAALMGWFGGDRVFGRLDQTTFRRVLLGALVGCALLAIGRAALAG